MSQVLGQLKKSIAFSKTENNPYDLLSGLLEADDAAVIKHDKSTAIVLTLDFFTPIVDDPYDFGAIAAANALSDIYAMGATPVAALNICCMPEDILEEILPDILRGGAEKVMEASAFLAGGHSVKDKEPKYGLSVMGIVHPDKIWEKKGAEPGDIIYLTKPVGTGLLTTAARADLAESEHLKKAIDWMKKLNKNGAEFFKPFNPKACTDVTGFGLTGHTLEIANCSKVAIRLFSKNIPLLPGAWQCACEDLFPAGTCHNKKNYSSQIKYIGISEEFDLLVNTPETSGGLLVVLAPEHEKDIFEQSKISDVHIWKIGVVEKGTGLIIQD